MLTAHTPRGVKRPSSWGIPALRLARGGGDIAGQVQRERGRAGAPAAVGLKAALPALLELLGLQRPTLEILELLLSAPFTQRAGPPERELEGAENHRDRQH